jgi:hypothetical protein
VREAVRDRARRSGRRTRGDGGCGGSPHAQQRTVTDGRVACLEQPADRRLTIRGGGPDVRVDRARVHRHRRHPYHPPHTARSDACRITASAATASSISSVLLINSVPAPPSRRCSSRVHMITASLHAR